MTALGFVDVETSGLDPHRHHVWEFAAVLADHDPADATLTVTDEIHLDIPLLATADAAALRIGGYYRRRTAAGRLTGAGGEEVARLDPRPAADRIARALADRHLVGANPAFDATFLDRLLRDHGQAPAWSHHLIDVSPLVAGYLQGVGQAQHAAGVTRERHDELINTGVPPYRSTELAEAIDVTVAADERHTALGDAWWALRQYATVYGLEVVRPNAEAVA